MTYTLKYYRNLGHVFHLGRNRNHLAVIVLYSNSSNCYCMMYEYNAITLKSNKLLICIKYTLIFLKYGSKKDF